jgi:uncharacterized protein YjbI with pentapeptide repeats
MHCRSLFIFICLLVLTQEVYSQAPYRNFKIYRGMPYFDTTYVIKHDNSKYNETINSKCFPGEFKLENVEVADSSFSSLHNFNIAYTDLYGAIFKRKVIFNNVDFKFHTRFTKAVFEKPVEFVLLDKGAVVELTKSHFFESAAFSGESISSFQFDAVTFEKYVSFAGKYRSSLRLDEVLFKDGVNFQMSQFNGLFLYRTKFAGVVNFSLSEFTSAPRIHEIVLPQKLIFERVNLTSLSPTEFVDFRLARLEPDSAKCIITVEGTDLSKLLLPFSLFELGFSPNTTYEIKCGLYEGVLKSCKDAGMLDSYKGWDIEYNKMKNIHNSGGIGRIKNFINKYWWNFGYEKWRILWIWLPAAFLMFLLYNLIMIKRLIFRMYFDEDLGSTFLRKRDKSNILSHLNKFTFRLSYTIFYTATIYFGLRLKHEAVNFQNFWYLVYLYLIFCVGALHMAFALSYILDVY